MRRISFIAASMIACTSAIATQQPASNQDDETVVVRDPESAFIISEASASYVVPGLLGVHSVPSTNAPSDASQSSTGTLALPPVTPFVTRAPSGDAAADREQYRLVQEIREREQRLLEDHEYRDLQRAKHRLTLSTTHPELADVLQIPKTQADQLLDLLAEHRIREEVAAVPMLPGPMDPTAVKALVDEAEERRSVADAELLALLGASKYQEWKEYDENAIARFLVQRYRSSLPDDAPLRPEQLRPLVSAIAREQHQLFELSVPRVTPGQVPDEAWQKRTREQRRERMSTAHQRILDASAPILSPRQLEQLQSMLQKDLDLHSQHVVTPDRSVPVSAPLRAQPVR